MQRQLFYPRYKEISAEPKSLQNDGSTGPDQIPAKFIRHVADCYFSQYVTLSTSASRSQLFTTMEDSSISPIHKINDQIINLNGFVKNL